MSAEVEWVLEQIGQSPVTGTMTVDGTDGVTSTTTIQDEPLKRVNRDNSDILEGDIRTRKADLQDGLFVGATLASVSTEPLGTEFDQRVEAVVGVRIEGLHHGEWGHVDPGGTNGIPFGELVDDVTTTLYQERQFPDVGRPDTDYHTLRLENHAPQSAQYRDYYRYDFDVRFVGYETLP